MLVAKVNPFFRIYSITNEYQIPRNKSTEYVQNCRRTVVKAQTIKLLVYTIENRYDTGSILKHMHTNVHSTIISNIEKLRATQMSINNGMDKVRHIHSMGYCTAT